MIVSAVPFVTVPLVLVYLSVTVRLVSSFVSLAVPLSVKPTRVWNSDAELSVSVGALKSTWNSLLPTVEIFPALSTANR